MGSGSGLKQITCASFREPGWRSQYSDQATGSILHDSFLEPIQRPIQWVTAFFPEAKRLEGEVTTELYLVRTLRTSGSIPPFPSMPS